jgi:hypothetical protein
MLHDSLDQCMTFRTEILAVAAAVRTNPSLAVRCSSQFAETVLAETLTLTIMSDSLRIVDVSKIRKTLLTTV